MLHSPNLLAIGLSARSETWPPIGWHHPFVISWSKYRLGLPSAPLHYGLMWPVWIPAENSSGRVQCPDWSQVSAIHADHWWICCFKRKLTFIYCDGWHIHSISGSSQLSNYSPVRRARTFLLPWASSVSKFLSGPIGTSSSNSVQLCVLQL